MFVCLSGFGGSFVFMYRIFLGGVASGLGGLSDGSGILLGGFQLERDWRERIQPERFGMEGLRGIGQGSVEPGSGRKMRRVLKQGIWGGLCVAGKGTGEKKCWLDILRKQVQSD